MTLSILFSPTGLFYPVLISASAIWITWSLVAKERHRLECNQKSFTIASMSRHPSPFTIGYWQVMGLVVFFIYITIASLSTLLPIPDNLADYCHDPHYRQSVIFDRLLPIETIRIFLERHKNGWSLADMLTSRAIQQIYLNILLTMPLGAFLALLFRRPFARTVAFGFSISLFWELTQLTGVWFFAECAWRWFDIGDLMLNTLGAILGWIIGKVIPSSTKTEMV